MNVYRLLIILSFGLLMLKLLPLRRLWGLPLKHGEAFFLGTPVQPDFYRDRGSKLLRSFRKLVLLPLAIDVALVVPLAVLGRFVLVGLEQFVSMLLTVVYCNLVVANFSVKAKSPSGPPTDEPKRISAVQLSLEPRRLRDYSVWPVEATIAAAILICIWIAAGFGAAGSHLPAAVNQPVDAYPNSSHRPSGCGVFLMVYLQLGLLLLKRMFVKWRMKLPMSRAEDYMQWRAAWLHYHLRVFDALRFFLALSVLSFMISRQFEGGSNAQTFSVLTWAAIGIGIVILIVYGTRENRRLGAAEREIKPVELVKEFPSAPVAEGRYLAGGLLYMNRDNPVMLARGAQGIAINIAHPGIYLWAGYVLGLILSVFW